MRQKGNSMQENTQNKFKGSETKGVLLSTYLQKPYGLCVLLLTTQLGSLDEHREQMLRAL